VKFTPKNGRVQITVSRVNSHVEIRVSDTGEGIKPDFLPHVFDRFRQADSGTTRRHGGLGLGLSIVKHLVELHGGTVQALSDGNGSGATFIVRLPVQIIHGHNSDLIDGRPHLSSHVSLSGLRVLLVDDDADSRELVRRLLKEHDAEVQTVGSAEEALESIRDKSPDILVSDIGMPDKDGYQLIQEVRSDQGIGSGKLPAIALTALARPEDRKRAMLAGYQSHVAKPVDPEELVAVIGSLTGRIGKSS
jgi:CheY-like chemotaxis protein